ncbi:MAG: GAF domain-containing protein [Campylobacterota bacterium]|nr:GAF domain-containing protein [Campylobacterota bacterium]
MKSFIKATEIWEPNKEKTQLTLVNGFYGSFKEFEDYSKTMTFDYNEGLPGKAWAQQHPIILKELEGSYFKRTEMANKIGLTCAIAMPIFAGEYLNAVVVFLCGDLEEHAGAIELWSKVPDRRVEMGLVEGYYGTMKDFEWISRSIKIMRGHGLPGSAWESQMPYIIKDLGESDTFLRSKKAAKEGITTALALPVWMIEEDAYVMTFLSAKGTPIARRFEIWVPDETGDALVYRDGHSDDNTNLYEKYALKRHEKYQSLPGEVWKTGCPILTTDTSLEENASYDALLALPLLQNGFCKAVVLFYY